MNDNSTCMCVRRCVQGRSSVYTTCLNRSTGSAYLASTVTSTFFLAEEINTQLEKKGNYNYILFQALFLSLPKASTGNKGLFYMGPSNGQHK